MSLNICCLVQYFCLCFISQCIIYFCFPKSQIIEITVHIPFSVYRFIWKQLCPICVHITTQIKHLQTRLFISVWCAESAQSFGWMTKLSESDIINQPAWQKQIIKPLIFTGNKDLKIITECFSPYYDYIFKSQRGKLKL